ncbi:hypothetical protein [Methylomonas sp. ZR1]|uniref:hypothetical protein n=1 Tax=Methylomonas sp. ZR1 TaxID=1797072 RepID=UPI001492C232|nr:hypothetical protein [Methylomonas sp. ZR1]NOV28782.1 hypothetical protein [Methylomonas sp. ZR1]
MGIFDFLKSIGKKEEPTNKSILLPQPNNSMPTIKPDKEIFECYDEVFKTMISDISGLTENEGKEIHSIIKKCDGGFLNMGGYHSIVWEKYFKGRDWQWDEYEEWNSRFTKIGKFPSSFPKNKVFTAATSEDALGQLKVSELKSLCTEHQLTAPAKAKKNDLVDLLKSISDIASNPLVAQKIEALNDRFSYGLYSLLMRTINFRGKYLYDLRRSEKAGVKKFKILYVNEEDKEFVEMALKIKPNALHPVFPSDMSMKQPVIEF